MTDYTAQLIYLGSVLQVQTFSIIDAASDVETNAHAYAAANSPLDPFRGVWADVRPVRAIAAHIDPEKLKPKQGCDF